MTRAETFAHALALRPQAASPEHHVDIPVLGVPVRFEARSRAALDGVAAELAAMGTAERDRAHDAIVPRIRLRVNPDVPRAAGAASLRIRSLGGERLVVQGDGVAASAWLGSMEAEAVLAPELIEDRARWSELVQTLVLFLVTRLDRQPVHAAAVSSGDTALVLAGRSGAGKSTLAFAARRAGLSVLGDDAVYAQLSPRLRLWGLGGAIHLPPDAGRHFPELRGSSLVVRANGKQKIRVEPDAEAAPPPAERALLCLIEPAAAESRVERIPGDEAVGELLARLDPGFDAFRDSIRPVLQALAGEGAWRLHVGGPPDRVLARLLERLGMPLP